MKKLGLGETAKVDGWNPLRAFGEGGLATALRTPPTGGERAGFAAPLQAHENGTNTSSLDLIAAARPPMSMSPYCEGS